MHRLRDFNMNCHVCGAHEDTAVHALLECPLTFETCSANPFTTDNWVRHYASITDCLLLALECLGHEEAGGFLGFLWEV